MADPGFSRVTPAEKGRGQSIIWPDFLNEIEENWTKRVCVGPPLARNLFYMFLFYTCSTWVEMIF